MWNSGEGTILSQSCTCRCRDGGMWNVERGTAVRARYSRKVAPACVAKPRKRGEILFSWSFKFLRKQAL